MRYINNKKWFNYHKHDHKGNIASLDVVVKMEDYCKRALELGHTAIFTTNHGYIGDVHEAITLGKKYGLNVIAGIESYFVPNRFEKDKRNFHLIIIALNHDGFLDINRISSEANKTGYYYKPRIDEELLYSINPKNVVITTACTGGVIRDDLEDFESHLIKMRDYFKENFFLEIQPHKHPQQYKHNKRVKDLSERLGIEMISACDTHYISEKDGKYRDMFLNAKGIRYPEEDGYILDYPDYETLVNRYIEQGVFTIDEIEKAINNTCIFESAEPLRINDDIKLPKVSDDSEKEFKDIITKAWLKERENIPKDRWKEYLDAIRYESKIVLDTNMQDYFILDKKVVEIAVNEYGGVITRTGRGSAPSFYINKLLGLTDIDRLNSPITLYPTRFISTARILETRSLADIDLNVADQEPFIKATQDLLGEDGVHWLLSYKPLQDSSAFRLFCKAKGMNINEYNEIAKDLEAYIDDIKWKDLIEESKVFKGVVESVAPSPCSFLLLDKPISTEVGIIKVGDVYCANLDGYNCDVYKYLKNDYLCVLVWSLIEKTCRLAGIKIPTINELNELLDEETFKMYELGLTCTLNQADSDFATNLIKRLKPKTVGEMSAFVAGIRPGFASLLDTFIERKSYSTGVEQLDELLKDSFHFLMYQESIMKFLVWLGIEESITYDIIKKIAKKKFKPEELKELKSKLTISWIEKVGSEKGFNETWQVIEDASRYSFNASHSLSVGLDSLYGAYLKSHYPLEYYSVALNEYSGDIPRTARLVKELEYFGIKFSQAKFRYSRGKYFFDRDNKTIYKGIGSIKYLNDDIGEKLYQLKDNKYEKFIDLLPDLHFVNSKQLKILIEIGFFDCFGKSKTLLNVVDIYNKYGSIKVVSTSHEMASVISMFSGKRTEKQLREIDCISLCNYMISNLQDEELHISEIAKSQLEHTGSIDVIDPSFNKKDFIVADIVTKYKTPKATIYQISTGRTVDVYISASTYNENPIDQFDLITVKTTTKKQKNKLIDGKWQKVDEYNYYITY